MAPAPRAPRGHARKAILASARALFIDEGYEINLEEVAAKAGVTKRTLYNHFDSKQALLEAVLEGEHEKYRRGVPNIREAGGLRGLLTVYGENLTANVLSYGNMKFYRLLAVDVSRFPEMAQAFYASGLRKSLQTLADRLDEGIELGLVRPVNTFRMAERYYAALTGLSQRRALACMPLDKAAERKVYMNETVEMFLELLTPR